MRKQCKPIEGPTPSIESLTSASFGSCSNGCVFQYVDLHSQSIPPEADVNVAMEIQIETQTAPLPMTRLVKDGCTSWEFSQSQVTTLEMLTRGQSTSSTWRDQRIGRITASNMHAVLLKVLHIEKCSPKPLDCSRLVQKLCLKSDDLDALYPLGPVATLRFCHLRPSTIFLSRLPFVSRLHCRQAISPKDSAPCSEPVCNFTER